MSNMHRVTWFDQQLRVHNYPNRESLAQKFEISTRQAQRDIDYLKNSMGAPLKYDAKRRGYYYEDETFMLPNVYINEEQKKMLEFLAYNYENYNQTPKVAQIAELFKKLTDGQDIEDDIPVFDLNKPIVHTSYEIFSAIRKHYKLKLCYKDPHKGDIEIIISPYKLFHKYRADYVACLMEDGGEISTLRLDRITDIRRLDESFEVRDDFQDSKYSSLIKKDPYTARIRFTKEPEFEDAPGINVRHVEEYVYDVEFFEIDDFINRLINMDYWEEICSPKWLKSRLRDRCSSILDKLG